MKILLASLGLLSLGLGILGIFLPLLPTTPFLLLSAGLFARSSERLHYWLMHHRIFGEYITAFVKDKALTIRTKIVSLTMMWSVMLYTTFAVVNNKWWLQVMLMAIATGVTIHILRFKTKK